MYPEKEQYELGLFDRYLNGCFLIWLSVLVIVGTKYNYRPSTSIRVISILSYTVL